MTGWPARIGVVLGALLLGWLSIAVTGANVYATKAPSIALWLWPGHALAEARLADSLVGSIQPGAASAQRAQVAQAAQNAAQALQRNPTLPAAARILAVQAAVRGDQRQSDRLLAFSEQLSRRDVLTQLALLERRVSANDVAGALSHFGIALQVAPSTQNLLFPVLSSALSQADLREPIAALVHRGDSWRADFLYYVAEHADPVGGGNLFLILARQGTPPTAGHLQPLIGRLVNARNYAGAARLYALVDRNWRLGDAAAELDGGFARSGDLAPFGWDLNQNIASRGPRSDQGENNALQISLSPSGEDWAARKLLLIGPGRYRLIGAYGMLDGGTGRVRIEISCTQGGNAAATINVAVNRPTGGLDGNLDIPGNCTQQWLTIYASGEGGENGGRLWLDDLRLVRAAG